jgi:hypothetical protein
MPRVAAIQDGVYATVVAEGRQDAVEAQVETLVRPSAEYIRHGPSARAWVKISAEEIRRPEILTSSMAEHAPEVARIVGAALHAQLCRTMEPDLATDRLLSVLVASYHLCADRARLEDTPPDTPVRRGLPFDRWLENLLDMAVAAVTAPPRR